MQCFQLQADFVGTFHCAQDQARIGIQRRGGYCGALCSDASRLVMVEICCYQTLCDEMGEVENEVERTMSLNIDGAFFLHTGGITRTRFS